MYEGNMIWKCPAQCGCEIQMWGTWDQTSLYTSPAGNISSYKHPLPFTAKNLQIMNVCAQHQFVLADPIDETPFFDINDEGDSIQNRGYLQLPIANPTDAEKLYVYLWRYNLSSIDLQTCKCRVYSYMDINDPFTDTIVPHGFSKKCKWHASDDSLHTQAIAENNLKNDALNAILAADPTLTEQDVLWAFDAKRQLSIDVPLASPQQKIALQTALQNNASLSKTSLV